MPPTKNGKQKDRFLFRDRVSAIIKNFLFTKKHCTNCGNLFSKENNDSKTDYRSNWNWEKRRKCPDCIKLGKIKEQEEKYCTFCGEKNYIENYFPKSRDPNKGWNSWGLCRECKSEKRGRKTGMISLIEGRFLLDLLDKIYLEFKAKKFNINLDRMEEEAILEQWQKYKKTLSPSQTKEDLEEFYLIPDFRKNIPQITSLIMKPMRDFLEVTFTSDDEDFDSFYNDVKLFIYIIIERELNSLVLQLEDIAER